MTKQWKYAVIAVSFAFVGAGTGPSHNQRRAAFRERQIHS